MKRRGSDRAEHPAIPLNASVPRVRIHGGVLAVFGVFVLLVVLLDAALLLTSARPAGATASDNVAGWAWSDTAGWLSMNDTNAGSGGGNYGVRIDPATRLITGYAWSPNQGWVCFGSTCSASCSGAALTPSGSAPSAWIDDTTSPSSMRGWALVCNLGAPNGWISLSNVDAGSGETYGPTVDYLSGTFTGYAWHGLAGPLGWGWIDFSDVTISGGTENMCTDGLDNDLDGAFDCGAGGDADCAAEPECIPEEGDVACADLIDNDEDGLNNCADPDCQTTANACTPPWLSVSSSGIYATQGIGGNAPPSTQSSATYCISSAGTISDFVSQEGCLESGAAPKGLPSNGNGYVSNIGRLDVAGILAGRYGTVENITSALDIDTPLAGKVYVFDRDTNGFCPSIGPDGIATAFTLPAKTFNNASGETGRGNGLIIIKGCDLVISGDSSYQGAGVSTYLRNLASVGVVVLAKYVSGVPTGGDIYVDSSVSQIVGLYFGERSIHTGSAILAALDVQLRVYGALVGRDIQLERRYASLTEPAEKVIFDGRGVVNPPPGLQDITKSLPSVRDTY